MDDISNMVMPVAPAYGGYNNGGFGNWGGDGWWIVLLLLACGGWGNGFGGGFGGGFNGFGNMMLGYDFPWLLNGQNGINNNVSDGFRDVQLNTNITSVRDGITSLSAQLCNCCNDISAQLYNNEIASLNRSFAEQTANTAGFTSVNAGVADLKYTLASEACATRAANTANTQAILDKLCQLELDGYKRENDNLRSQLNMASLAASQTAQTAELRQSGATQLNQLVSELRSCPIPSQPVYGNSPIFTCATNVANSCGCNGFGFNG